MGTACGGDTYTMSVCQRLPIFSTADRARTKAICSRVVLTYETKQASFGFNWRSHPALIFVVADDAITTAAKMLNEWLHKASFEQDDQRPLKTYS